MDINLLRLAIAARSRFAWNRDSKPLLDQALKSAAAVIGGTHRDSPLLEQGWLANRSFLGVENPRPFLNAQVGGPLGRIGASGMLGVDSPLAVESERAELLEEERKIEGTGLFDQLPSPRDEILARREELPRFPAVDDPIKLASFGAADN
jgi:hypothetical protein